MKTLVDEDIDVGATEIGRRSNAVKNKTLTSIGKHRLRQSTLEGDDDRRGTHKSTDCVNEQ